MSGDRPPPQTCRAIALKPKLEETQITKDEDLHECS